MRKNYKNGFYPFFLALIVLLMILIVGFGAKAATQTAWPTASNNEIIVRMDGPWGDGGIVIGATTSWNTSTDGEMTVANLGKKQRTITLTQKSTYAVTDANNPNPYNARLATTSTKTIANDYGNYFVLQFNVVYTIPAHYKYTGYERTNSNQTTGRNKINNAGDLSHGAQRDVTVTYEVTLANFGMRTSNDGVRRRREQSVIRLGIDIYDINFSSTAPNGSNQYWPNTVTCGSGVEAPTPDDVDYYKFIGWSDGQNVVAYAGNTVYTCGSSKTLYAYWKNDYYNITYYPNGGTGNATTQTVDLSDSNVTLEDEIFSRAHYEFTGWGTNTTGGTIYSAGSTVKHLASTVTTINLYAQWRNILHTVTFDGNGATSGSMNNMSGDEGDSIELPACGFKKKGYYFCGWATSKNGSTVYRDGDDFPVAANTGGETTTLYAVWSRDGSFQVDNVIDDTSMFEGCDNLVGGNGTKYDYSHKDSKEANIDIPSDRGYFTAK